MSVYTDVGTWQIITLILLAISGIVVLFVLRQKLSKKNNEKNSIMTFTIKNIGFISLVVCTGFFWISALLVLVTGEPQFPLSLIIDPSGDWYGPGAVITKSLLIGILLFIPIFYALIELAFRIWIHDKSQRARKFSPATGVTVGAKHYKPYAGKLSSNFDKFIGFLRISFLSTFVLYGFLALILSNLHVFRPDVRFEAVDNSNIFGIFNWSVESGFIAFFILCWALSLVFTAFLLGKDLVLPFRIQIIIFAAVMFLFVAFVPIRILIHPVDGVPYWETRTMLDFFFASDPSSDSIYFLERIAGLFIGGLTFFLTTNVILAFVTSIGLAGAMTAIRYVIPTNLFDFLFGWVTGARIFVAKAERHKRKRPSSPVKLKTRRR